MNKFKDPPTWKVATTLEKPQPPPTIMGADVLVTQGAKPPATMIFIMLNWINSIPVH